MDHSHKSDYRIPRCVTERPGPQSWALARFQAWTMDPYDAGELLAAGGRVVSRRCCTKPLRRLPSCAAPGDASAEGNRYHNKRFVAMATEMGLAGPERPGKVVGWSDCRIHRRDGGRLCGRRQRDRQRAAFPSCRQVTAPRSLT